MDKKRNERELNKFQIRNLEILTHLLKHEAVTDEIVESLRQSELDYFSLINKTLLLEKSINIDEKTGLLKFSNSYLTNIIKTASRIFYGHNATEYTISFIRFDIDDFSHFNNKFGHDFGDEVLIGIAEVIKENSRPTDYVIRYGGEEFDVILPSTKIEGTVVYAKNMFDMIHNFRLRYNGQDQKVTVSAGISSLVYTFQNTKVTDENEVEQMFKDLQRKADNALYEAKYLGKDRYCVYSEERKDEYQKIRKLYTK
jgi:diguanylate cyclase (GGDEF)-like protein